MTGYKSLLGMTADEWCAALDLAWADVQGWTLVFLAQGAAVLVAAVFLIMWARVPKGA